MDERKIGVLGIVLLIIGIVLMAMTGLDVTWSLSVLPNALDPNIYSPGLDVGVLTQTIAGFFIGLALLIVGILLLLYYVKIQYF